MKKLSLFFGLASFFLSYSVYATDQYDMCFIKSAKKHNVDFKLLKAIAKVESSFNPFAMNKNETSIDMGLMQINSTWLPKLSKMGISRQDLFNPCVSIEVGSWILANNIQKYGNTWNAVGAYNARSIDKRKIYVAKVKNAYQTINGSSVASVTNNKIRVI